MIKLKTLIPFAAIFAALTGQALAHSGGAHIQGIGSGFAHTLTGADHMLAMVAVGLVAARLGGRAVWLLPLAFVATMVAGAATAMAGVDVPFTETGIVGSVLVFGAMLASRAAMPLAATTAATALFAFLHGVAHGVEGPAASNVGYVAGFIAATAGLHAAGILAGGSLIRIGKRVGEAALRVAGALIIGAGIGLAFAA